MLGDIFDTPEEILSGVKEGQVQSTWDRLPRNCADELNLPEKQKKQGYPVGLKNQGATCYLNSLFQILYHTPELRQIILQLPLCENSVDNKSNFVEPKKQSFLMGFQRLFSQMSMLDVQQLSTEYLKAAFGWENAEHIQQQDIQQAMRITLDTISRALEGTQFQEKVKGLFKGYTARYKSCRTCTVSNEKVQQFYDLCLQVKEKNSLQESIMGLISVESMQGSNKIFCETCDCKQDMWFGTKVKVLPQVIVFSLNRFDFDYQKMDRVKLNDFFKFDLQLSLGHLLEEDKNQSQYQLYGVVIHRGSAHGGHYFCYVRDVLQQLNWKKGLQQAKKQEEEFMKQRTPDQQLTQEQKIRRKDFQKQKQTHELKQPNNKKLLQNWFQINDSISTSIDPIKITSKYQGSESAYILFYRKVGILQQNLKLQVPLYFQNQITKQNLIKKQQRQKYQIEKNQIEMTINEIPKKLSINMTIQQLLGIYCTPTSSLVLQAKYNDLPYYPMQLNVLQHQYQPTDTISSYDIYHGSIWKSYQITSAQYTSIKSSIGKLRMPFSVNIVYELIRKTIILYQDETVFELRKKIQKDLQIPYENQIIKLVTQYKELFITDDLTNDDLLLSKIGFIHQCQILINFLKQKKQYQQKQQILQEEKKKYMNSELLCFIIERDDIIGIKRLYFNKNKTLQELLNHIIKIQALINFNMRFRNLNGNRLYYQTSYKQKLQNLDFDQEMIKLRIEKGQIPIKGDICIKVKIQSKFVSEVMPSQIERVYDPNTIVCDLKKDICLELNLQPNLHKLYLTDWIGQPVRTLAKQKQSIFDASFSREQIICLRDIQSPIGSELVHLEVFTTQNGSCDNISSNSFYFKIEEYKTIEQFKNQLSKVDKFRKLNLKSKQLRIRQIKRDYMFGNIWKNSNKAIKDQSINSNKIVVQIMQEEENLSENEIVLILKQRDSLKRTYNGNIELIFNAGKNPSIEDLKISIIQKLKLPKDYLLTIIKYFNYNFQWIEINKKIIEQYVKGKNRQVTINKQKKNKNKKQKQKQKQKQKYKQKQKQKQKQIVKQNKQILQNKINQQVKNQSNLIQENNLQNNKNNKIVSENQKNKILEKQQQKIINKQQNCKKQNVVQSKQGNKKKVGNKKGKKQGKQQELEKQQKKLEECLNLRKAPTLLKDGDWIGYGCTTIIEELKDQLQTDEDLSLREVKKHNKQIGYTPRRPQGKGFKYNIQF